MVQANTYDARNELKDEAKGIIEVNIHLEKLRASTNEGITSSSLMRFKIIRP
ncbi:unnamed protein product [Arabidopsis thaliana]|uniref:(thale cress) hypothetical protein n=1 Tax=Arabidopsis thaliana TaxID=3702 RepID=A0A7G2EBE3_ARATH|nr:unnamed protein product [Arabidopsis thaliana]